MNAYDFVPELAKMLRNLDGWLEKAAAHAKAKGFDPNVLAEARLAPDQYSLVEQVQSACDAAKFAAASLSGTEAPSHPDTEKTMAELSQRIRTCLAYLDTMEPAAFAGAEERKVAPRWLKGKWLIGHDYLVDFAIPNFFFHVVTAYSILRHNGVDVGKMDFIGSLAIKDA